MCLDTDIVVGLLKGDEDAASSVKEFQHLGEIVATTDISAYELLKGANISSKPQENLKLVRDVLSSLSILVLDLDSCEIASNIYREIKGKGQTIGEFDVLIAAIAIKSDETLVSRDKHFRLVGNLDLRTW